MLQDMNDRYTCTLAMIGLVKTLLTINAQKQTVRKRERMTDIVFDLINSFNVIIRYAIEKICSLSSFSFSMRLGNKYLVSNDSSENHFGIENRQTKMSDS